MKPLTEAQLRRKRELIQARRNQEFARMGRQFAKGEGRGKRFNPPLTREQKEAWMRARQFNAKSRVVWPEASDEELDRRALAINLDASPFQFRVLSKPQADKGSQGGQDVA